MMDRVSSKGDNFTQTIDDSTVEKYKDVINSG